MKDEEVIAELRSRRLTHSAAELAELLETLHGEGLSQGTMIAFFKRAFPAIPLRVLLDAGEWRRVGEGGKSDDWFNELLRPWLETRLHAECGLDQSSCPK